MDKIDLFYSNTKAGTYIQFKMPVNTCELEELNSYDKYLKKQINKEFGDIIKDYDMEFSTDSSYIIGEGETNYLVICLQGETTPELENTLKKTGIEKKEFL